MAQEYEVLTKEERIARLQQEMAELGGTGDKQALIQLLQNPGLIRSKLNLTESQSSNVKSLIAGAGTAASVKYLGRAFGDEIAAIMGAAVSAFIARKIFG